MSDLTATMRDRLTNKPEFDMEEAVNFAEIILGDFLRVDRAQGRGSVTEARRLNLARCFLKLKYPFLCCGQAKSAEQMCAACPMKEWREPETVG